VLDAGHHVGTLSTIADGRPWVVPMLSAYGPPQTSAHATPGLPVSPSVTEFLRG
jgi:nitroimidazol reductase NimA-like FMN-containing flavoprotein (pyridoxamine 5'-phosphate oxidase superfamily)